MDAKQRGDTGQEGVEDVQMAAEAETGVHMEDMCSLIDFKCPSCGEGGFNGRRLSRKFCRSCAGKQMLPTIAALEKKLMLHSDSIHSSLKSPKAPFR